MARNCKNKGCSKLLNAAAKCTDIIENKGLVYKIKLIDLDGKILHIGDEWALGTNIFKRGGSGKTWTSKKLVNKSFNQILNTYKSYIGVSFNVEIVTFSLKEISSSSKEI